MASLLTTPSVDSISPEFYFVAPSGLIQSHKPQRNLELCASPWCSSWGRRLFDLSISILVLALAALPMLLIAALVRLTSDGPALFKQQRVGRHGKLFWIFKFRSMGHARAGNSGPGLTRDGDQRITPIGRVLRKLKLDELPQFINILRGEMSLVGPRPKLPKYEAFTSMPYRPGITGAATLAFRNEEEILRGVMPENLDDYYARHIQPLKARIDASYMSRANFLSDLKLISDTFLACLAPERVPSILPEHLHPNTHAPLATMRKFSTSASIELAN